MWNGQVLNQSFPPLYSFAKQENATVKSILSIADFYENLHLPLSEEAYEEFRELSVYLQSMEISEEKDKWSYIWGSAEYSSRKAYKHLSGSSQVQPSFGWIWRSCQMKHKVFYWLLLQNRLNTRSMLRRRHMIMDSYACEPCLRQVDESNRHLFFRCSFAKKLLVTNWGDSSNMAKTRPSHKTYKEIFGCAFCNGDFYADDLVHMERKKCLVVQQSRPFSRTL
jgi:hypothetical protein